MAMNELLKALRKRRALSLSELAQMSNVSRVTINRIENGKQKPLPRTIRRLAKALQVGVEELTSDPGPLSR
jgi:transcriptional regulator with XRE-family HTH domain